MKIKTIYDKLNEISPFELQEKWDNSGLILGNMDRDVEEVVLSLDVDIDNIQNASEGTLFIVHHPLIFGKLTELDFSKYPANLIEMMILKKQSLIAMHTNFDKTHLNRYVFERVLGFEVEVQNDFLCMARGEWRYKELLAILRDKLNLSTLKVIGKKEKITSIALTTGSGASLLGVVEADCFLTGDIKYHDAMSALSQDLMMVDIGHYESEKFFGDIMLQELKVLPILAIISNSKNPFYIENI